MNAGAIAEGAIAEGAIAEGASAAAAVMAPITSRRESVTPPVLFSLSFMALPPLSVRSAGRSPPSHVGGRRPS
jgi:hypothetical protein